jgi:hypothetical protein
MAGATNPVVRFSRWFTNDQGGSPGDPTDTLKVDASNDDGQNWTLIHEVGAGTPLAWVPVEIALPGSLPPTNEMRFRFTAEDLGAGSLVEAGVDDFSLVDVEQGCNVCGLNPPPICSITANRSGDDVVLSWGVDPGRRVTIYHIPACNERLLLGTVEDATSFVHEGAALSATPFNYRVTSVDGCGQVLEFCGDVDTDCPR